MEYINKLEKFSGGYIDPVLGKIIDIDKQIDKASKEIAGAFAGIIRGVRYKAFDEINKKINEKIDFLSPSLLFLSGAFDPQEIYEILKVYF